MIIENPRGFPAGITTSKIITHPSVPHNKLIAETLQRLKYVQRTGQGVDIIFRDMLVMGKTFPKYRVPKYREFSDAVALMLKNVNEYPNLVEFISQEQQRLGKSLSLAEIMVLRYLYEHKKIIF